MNATEAITLSMPILYGALDIALAKSDRPLITSVLRRHKVITLCFLALLAGHTLDILGPCDPFKAIGRTLAYTRSNP